jgi:hypothetical protein
MDIGSWCTLNGTAVSFKSKALAPSGAKWMAKATENWVAITGILNKLNAKWFTIGNLDLMPTREIRKSDAEFYVTTMARIQPYPPSELHHTSTNWASDGSMTPAASGIGDPKSVTAALTGPSTIVF